MPEITCAGCGARRGGSPDSLEPCSVCASITFQLTVHEQSIGLTDSVSFSGKATPDRSWSGQWKRVQCSLSLLPGIAPPSPVFDFGAAEDAFVHFFQDAYHFKDWLKNDAASAPSVGTVEDYVTSSGPLSLIGDLANGSKHLLLRSTKTGDLATRFGEVHFDGDPTVGLVARFEVLSNGVVHDAIDLARAACAEWETYLRSVGLLAQ